MTGIQIETGVLGGTVSVQAAGATLGDAKTWTSFPGKSDASKAGNAITLRREHFEQARAGVALMRQLLSANHAALAAPMAMHPIEQLQKLGELRDAGVITAAEFDAKKADILARM